MTSDFSHSDERQHQGYYHLNHHLPDSEQGYQQLIETLREIVFKVDRNGNLIFLNAAWARVLGYPVQESLGHHLCKFLHPDDWSIGEMILHHLSQDGRDIRQELRFQHQANGVRWLEVVAHSEAGGGALGTLFDITEHKEAINQLRYAANHDVLTGLLNRVAFTEQLRQTIARYQYDVNEHFAIFFLDLDGFKLVNDSLGHLIGDQLLKEVSARIKSCLRPMDAIARFGGDEFMILLKRIASSEEALFVSQRIHHLLTQGFHLDGHEVFTSTSIGIVLGSTGIRDAEKFIRDADIAMYHAKLGGKSRSEVFDHQMHTQAIERLQIETDLRRGLDQNEFELYYQPIISLMNCQVSGLEALVRWHHPHRGLVAPDYFIQIAEESGLIKPLGWWVLYQACQQLRLWQEQALLEPSVVMSVNLSSKQFLQFDLFEHIQQTLVDTKLSRHNLKLEITESTVMNDLDNTALKLRQLRNSGIHLSIDDFGTGYSSLSYLHRFPFDTLKVDRSFIGRMDQQRENSAIVKTIVDLAHNLGMDIVAEGVESQQQLHQLQRLGCEQVQGYFFAPPLPADCLVEYFQKIQMDRNLRSFFSLG